MLKSQIQACVLSSYETRSADPTCTLEVKHFGNDQETKPHIKVKTALQILFFFFFLVKWLKMFLENKWGWQKESKCLQKRQQCKCQHAQQSEEMQEFEIAYREV